MAGGWRRSRRSDVVGVSAGGVDPQIPTVSATLSYVKKPVSRVTGTEGGVPGLATRVLADGLESVGGVVHGALEAARSAGQRARQGDSAGTRPDGRSARWAGHRAERREELIDAAIRAIAEHGAAVGMDQIAASAHTSKPVIYRYFADKTDLRRAVSRRAVGEVLRSLVEVTATDPPPRELLHAGVAAYLTLLEANPELYRFVAQNPLVDDDATDFSTAVAEVLTQQLAMHLAGCDLDPAFASPWGEGMVGFINAASLWWLDHPDVMTRPQLTDYLSALLWGGVAGVLQAAGQVTDAAPAPGVFPPRPR